MLCHDSLTRFVQSLGPDGKVFLQDLNGRVIEVGPRAPDTDELIEVRATHFKIADRPWISREDFVREFEAWERSEF